MQVLFCRYNDPSYVKLEKLEIMVKLASAQNIDQVPLRKQTVHHIIAGWLDALLIS